MKKQVRIAKHGEVRIVKEDNAIVTGIEVKSEEDIILADSETTGNHHMLKMIPGVHVFRDDKLDKYFVKADVDTKVYCKLDNRHTDYKLKGGNTYSIYKAREYDHIEKVRRSVRD